MPPPPDDGGAPPSSMAGAPSPPPMDVPSPSPQLANPGAGGGPLEMYMAQKGMAGQGMGPRGGGGMPATPMGPGIADPFTGGDDGPSLMNPDDAQNEFDPRRRPRPYMGG